MSAPPFANLFAVSHPDAAVLDLLAVELERGGDFSEVWRPAAGWVAASAPLPTPARVVSRLARPIIQHRNLPLAMQISTSVVLDNRQFTDRLIQGLLIKRVCRPFLALEGAGELDAISDSTQILFDESLQLGLGDPFVAKTFEVTEFSALDQSVDRSSGHFENRGGFCN